jgi:hypothetical protein
MDVFHDEHIESVNDLLRIEQKWYFFLTPLGWWQRHADGITNFGVNLCHASGIGRTVYSTPATWIVECEVR